ncbi:MAG: hypothetical protein Q8O56_17685 [Solirubrobacteraceae bacterium]|nr:hypothetical protein [Solirubrobacteraceae bacterium]
MDEITHISVDSAPDSTDPTKARAFYVEPPESDPLEEEPFGSGRHRIEQLPGGANENEDEPKRSATLWSWSLPRSRRGG